jgi:signal recognition particle GTPase
MIINFLKPKKQRIANASSRRLVLKRLDQLKANADKNLLYSVSEKIQEFVTNYINYPSINYGSLSEFDKILSGLSTIMKPNFSDFLIKRLDSLIYLLVNPIESFSNNPSQHAIEIRKMISFEKQSLQGMIVELRINLDKAFKERNKSSYEEIENEIELLESELAQLDINYQIYSQISKNLRKIEISKKNAKLTSEAAKISSSQLNPSAYKTLLDQRTDDINIIKHENERLSDIDNQNSATLPNNIFNKRSSFDDRVQADLNKNTQQDSIHDSDNININKIK